MQVGWFGAPGREGSVTHVVGADGKTLCGVHFKPPMKFQWCSNYVRSTLIECQRCQRTLDAWLRESQKAAKAAKKPEPKKKFFRVWIEQVNATYVDVDAISVEDARVKGYAKWRREYASSRVTDVRQINEEDADL